MPPQFQDQFNIISSRPKEKFPKWTKYILIVLSVFIALLAILYWLRYINTFQQRMDSAESSVQLATTTNQLADWKTYRNEKYGFEINYPFDFIFKEQPDGVALVSFWNPQNPIGGIGTKIYLRHSNFSLFNDFVRDMRENYIFNLVKSNNGSLSDKEARDEVKKFEGQYSFETKKINNANALVHSRNFFGLDGASETYIWIENGDYLLIYGSNLDLNSFKFTNQILN